MNRCEFIDVNAIIKIVYNKENVNKYLEWRPEKNEEVFFGLFKPNIYPEGFYELNGWENMPYEISILEKDYNIKDNIVYNKPKIIIYLKGCSDKTVKTFHTNNEAEEYILKLENLRGKKFECITK